MTETQYAILTIAFGVFFGMSIYALFGFVIQFLFNVLVWLTGFVVGLIVYGFKKLMNHR